MVFALQIVSPPKLNFRMQYKFGTRKNMFRLSEGKLIFEFFWWILENQLLVNRNWKSRKKCCAIKLRITWYWSLGDGEKKICLQLFDILSFYCRKLAFNLFLRKLLRKIFENRTFFYFYFFFHSFFVVWVFPSNFDTSKWLKNNTTATPLK